jgi:hypothetical protein
MDARVAHHSIGGTPWKPGRSGRFRASDGRALIRTIDVIFPRIWPFKRLMNAAIETDRDSRYMGNASRTAGTPGHTAGGTSHVA